LKNNNIIVKNKNYILIIINYIAKKVVIINK